MRQIDPRIDVAAILAEISHIVDESVVLSKIELVAEPFAQPDGKDAAKGASIRIAGKAADTPQDVPLGDIEASGGSRRRDGPFGPRGRPGLQAG